MNGRRVYPVVRASLAVLAVVVASVVLAAAAIKFSRSLSGPFTEPVDLARVSECKGVDFPADASLRHSLGIRHGIDFELYAQVDIDRKDVPALIAALKKDPYQSLSRTNRMDMIDTIRNWRNDTPVPKWWRPESDGKFIAASGGLLISLSHPRRATVWVHFDSDRPMWPGPGK